MKTAATDNKPSRLHDVFVSYSRKDKEFVRRLDEALRARERESWVDWDDLRPAEEFMQAIYAAIESANAFVFVLTPESLASEVCGREIAHAVAHHKRMIPVVAREVNAADVPPALAALNWIFCRDNDDFAAAVATLIEALDTDLPWVRAHTRLLTRALEWKANKQSHSFALRGEDLRNAEQWLAQAGAQKERHPTELQTEYILASRKAANRRQRLTVGALSFGLILALVLAAAALISREKAVKAEALAVAGRQRADAVIRFVQNNLPDKLRPIGRLDLMADVAVEVDKYYDALREAEGESVDTFAGKSWAAINQAGIDQEKGRLEPALAKYRTALQLAERALLVDPDSQKAREYEATARLVLGIALQQAGQADAAIEQTRKAGQAFEKLAASNPSNARWQSQLATSISSEGIYLLIKEQLDPALAKFRQATAIREKLVASAPEDMQRLSDLANSQNSIAAVLLEQRQLEAALKAYRTAQGTMRKLVQLDSRNADWQRNLALSFKNIGSVLQAQGEAALALPEFEQHAAAIEKVAAGDPSNATWQRETAEAHVFLGNAYFQQNRLDEGLGQFRLAHSSMIRLAAADPANTMLQLQALLTCPQVAVANIMAGAKGDLAEAAQAVQRGVTIFNSVEKSGGMPPNLAVLRDKLKNLERDLASMTVRRPR